MKFLYCLFICFLCWVNPKERRLSDYCKGRADKYFVLSTDNSNNMKSSAVKVFSSDTFPQ